MSRFPLHTYKDFQQFNTFYKVVEKKGKTIHPFLYDEFEDLLSRDEEKILDISVLIENLQTTPGNKIHALLLLRNLDETFQVIIKEELAQAAINIFPTIFDRVKLLEGKSKKIKVDSTQFVINRKVLYTYSNTEQLEKIIEFTTQSDIPFSSISTSLFSQDNGFKERATKQRKSIIDVTSLVQATTSNPYLIFHAEQVLGTFPYYDAIIREEFVDQALDTLRFLFYTKMYIQDLISDVSVTPTYKEHIETSNVVRVIDLNSSKRELLFKALKTNLIGHTQFKRRFGLAVRNFIGLNMLKERRVLSIFLLGGSGLGKTEVARIINRTLNPVSPLAKINFGNYSSKDALNSLIGSPRGYIGSEDGELSIKLRRSNAGILLCDEFEKATRPIFDFFLELLEDGYSTDSMAREIDLDGYIIIFTGNINERQFSEQIPPELRSRFDLVCEFEPLSMQEKLDFIEYCINTFLERLSAGDHYQFTEEDLQFFRAINPTSTNNLRDIKRMIQERIISRMKYTEDENGYLTNATIE